MAPKCDHSQREEAPLEERARGPRVCIFFSSVRGNTVYEVDMEVRVLHGRPTCTASPALQISPLVGDAAEHLRGDLNPGQEGEAGGQTKQQLKREVRFFHGGRHRRRRATRSRNTKHQNIPATGLALQVVVVQARMLERVAQLR